MERKRKRIIQKMETAPFVRLQDKITFMFSIYLMCAFTYLYGRDADNRYFTFVTIFVPCLIATRINYYWGQGWHYYLIDFCYYATALSIFVIHFDPKNEQLFRTAFLFSNGNLAISIAAFRNSLVFHRIDYIVSLAIHAVPMLTMIRIRWHSTIAEASLPENEKKFFTLTETSSLDWSEYLNTMLYHPTKAYLAWAVLYFLIIFVINAKTIVEKNYDNLFRYFASSGLTRTILKKSGKKGAPLAFMFFHFLFYLTGHLLGIICYHY